MKYFGDPKFRKEDEEQVETPVGQLCIFCDEEIAETDTGNIYPSITQNRLIEKPCHYECQMRGIVGSVGHQMKKCSCFGGTEEDPPGSTKHEAAIAAARYWHLHN